MPAPETFDPATVLLVQSTYEDERLALRALRWCERPLLVRSVRDGEAAHRALKGETPDLVLCDLQLPELDGHELLRRTRADDRLSAVSFVLLSRVPSPSEVERGRELGATAFLQRPIPFEESMGLFHAVVGWALDGADASKLTPFLPVLPNSKKGRG